MNERDPEQTAVGEERPFADRVAEMSPQELRRRLLTQRDYMRTRYTKVSEGYFKPVAYDVACHDCGLMTPEARDKQVVAGVWNRRANEGEAQNEPSSATAGKERPNG